MLRAIQTILIVCAVIGVLYVGFRWFQGGAITEFIEPNLHIVRIGENVISVRVADTENLRKRGLSGVKELPVKQGMLFVFDTTERHGIWMEGMIMSIDIIWIDESFRVVGIEHSVSPETYPKIFKPPVPVRYVIETSATYTDTFGVRVGDEADVHKWASKQ